MLWLLALGVHSAAQQRAAMRTVSTSNLLLSGEILAATVPRTGVDECADELEPYR